MWAPMLIGVNILEIVYIFQFLFFSLPVTVHVEHIVHRPYHSRSSMSFWQVLFPANIYLVNIVYR